MNGELADEASVIGWGWTIAYWPAEDATNTFVVRAFDTSGNMSAPSNEVPFDC